MNEPDIPWVTEKELKLNDFARGFVDSVNLYQKNIETRSGPGFAVAAGLITAFPEKVNYKTLNKSVEFHRLSATAYVATLINDYLDMQTFLDTSDGSATKLHLEELWKKTLEGIGFQTELPQEDRDTIKSYMAGVTLLDDLERSNPNKSLSAVIKAKELENAISLVHCAALVVGKKEIGINCLNLFEDVGLETLREKYDWIIKGKPENEVQRRLCAIFNVVILTQTVDDQFDTRIDDKLQARNIYSSLLKENFGNKQVCDRLLKAIQNKYFVAANKFGISGLAFLSNKKFMEFVKKVQYRFPNIAGGQRERLIK